MRNEVSSSRNIKCERSGVRTQTMRCRKDLRNHQLPTPFTVEKMVSELAPAHSQAPE